MISDFERLVEENPNDVGPYLVYADWLLAQGDPQGELIAVQAALEEAPTLALWERERALLANNRTTLLGQLAHMSGVTWQWRLGFLEAVALNVGSDSRRALSTLEALPTARLLRDLHVALSGKRGTHRPILRSIAKLRSLRKLSLQGDRDLGPIEVLYAPLERLEHLEIDIGRVELGTIKLPALRTLRIRIDRPTPANVRAIFGCDCPELAHLAIEGFPDALLGSSLLRRLRTLELFRVDDAAARKLLDNVASFAHLTRLTLARHVILDEALASRVATSSDNFVVDVKSDYIADLDAGAAQERARSGNVAEGLALIDGVIAAFPRVARYWCVRAEWGEDLDPDRALADFGRALAIDPKFVQAYSNRASLRAKLGDAAGAIADATERLRIRPDDRLARNNRAYYHFLAGDLVRAEIDARTVIEADGGYALAHLTLAEVLTAAGRHAEAFRALLDGLTRDPSYLDFARTSPTVAALRELPDFESRIRARLDASPG